MRLFSGILALAILTASCSSRIYPEQARPYILNKSNGLTVSDTFGSLKVTCIYFPNEYTAWEESKRSGENYVTVLKDLSSEQFFELRLSDSSGTREFLRIDDHPAHYQERLNYLLTGIQNDIVLIDGGDTLRKPEVIVERAFGVVPYNTVLLSFPNKNPKLIRDKTLLIYDPVAGGRPLTFTIHENNINRFPQIRQKNKSHDISAQQPDF